MNALVMFLLARIVEDESAASDDPVRLQLLRGCEARRALVADYREQVRFVAHGRPRDGGPIALLSELDKSLRIAAAVYAHHPDYDERWRP